MTAVVYINSCGIVCGWNISSVGPTILPKDPTGRFNNGKDVTVLLASQTHYHKRFDLRQWEEPDDCGPE